MDKVEGGGFGGIKKKVVFCRNVEMESEIRYVRQQGGGMQAKERR